MIPGFLLVILKFASIALTGLFGVLALLVDYKDSETGKVTIWGRRAIIGIIASTFIAAGSTALEVHIERITTSDEARGLIAQTETILKEVQRAIEPLETVEISVGLRVPITDASLSEFRDKLHVEGANFARIVEEHPDDYFNRVGSAMKLRSVKDGRYMVELVKGEALDPYTNEGFGDPLIYDMWEVGISAYRTPVEPKKAQVARFYPAGVPDPDFTFRAYAPAHQEAEVYHWIESDEVILVDKRMVPARGDFRTSEVIASIPDLVDSQVLFWAEKSPHRDKNIANAIISDHERKMAIERIILKIGRREFEFSEANASRIDVATSSPVWQLNIKNAAPPPT